MQIERKGRKMIQGIFVRCRRCVSESEDSFIYKPTHPHIHLPTHTPSHPYTYTHPYNYPTVHLSTHTPIHPYTGWIGVILVHNCVLPLISFYWADKSSIFINYWTILSKVSRFVCSELPVVCRLKAEANKWLRDTDKSWYFAITEYKFSNWFIIYIIYIYTSG